MARSKRPLRIGIWGHYGGCNQGDELVVTTLIANIRARVPDAEIVGYSLNPADTRERHGIPALPLRRSAYEGRFVRPWSPEQESRQPSSCEEGKSRWKAFLKRWRPLVWLVRGVRMATRSGIRAAASLLREFSFLVDSYRSLRGMELLIVAGSGPLFDDWSGPWGHPYAMYKWSALARLSGTRFACLSTGAGPIDSPLSRIFLRRAVRTTSYRSYRDASSARLMASLGVPGEHPVFPDMGFGLDAASYVRPWEPPGLARNRTLVGLGVMAYCDPRYIPRNDPRRYAAYIRKMAGFTAWLLRNDYAVLAVSSDIWADPQAFVDVRDVLRREHGLDDDPRLVEPPVDGLATLASLFSSCDYVIAARYHCIVLPWLLGKPVVALAYNRKHIDLMESMGQEAYCVDIDRFEVAELVERFRAMECNRDAIRTQLLEGVARCRARLAEQYDRVLGPPVAAR